MIAPRLELVPVIELEPHLFRTATRPYPHEIHDNSPDADLVFWKACIGDRGLAFDPLLPHSRCVALEVLTESASDAEIELIVRLAKRINGGYALREGDAIESHETCCAKLRDLAQWRLVFESPPQDELWIAHCGVSSRREGPAVRVSILHECDRGEGNVLEVPTDRIHAMFEEAEAAVLAFQARLLEAARAAGWPDADAAVAELTQVR